MQSTSPNPRQDEIIYIQHPIHPHAPPVDRDEAGDIDDSWSEGIDHNANPTVAEAVAQSQTQENRAASGLKVRRSWSDDGESSGPESDTDESYIVSAASSTSTDSSSDSSAQQIATVTAHAMAQPAVATIPSAARVYVGACSSRPGIILAVAASLVAIAGVIMLGIGFSGSGLQQNDQSDRDRAKFLLQIFGGVCAAVGAVGIVVLAEDEWRNRGCC